MAKQTKRSDIPPDRRQSDGDRPIVILRVTYAVSLEELDRQQAAAELRFRPFGIQPLVIPREFEFVGVIPPGR